MDPVKYTVYKRVLADITNQVSADVEHYLNGQTWFVDAKTNRRVDFYVCLNGHPNKVQAIIKFKDIDLKHQCEQELRQVGFPIELIRIEHNDYVWCTKYGWLQRLVLYFLLLFLCEHVLFMKFTLVHGMEIIVGLFTLRELLDFNYCIIWSGGLPYVIFYPYMLSGLCYFTFWVPFLLRWINIWQLSMTVILLGWYLEYKQLTSYSCAYGLLMTYLIIIPQSW